MDRIIVELKVVKLKTSLKTLSLYDLQSYHNGIETTGTYRIMETTEKNKLLKQILWDYNVPVEEIESVLKGKRKLAGHYNREMLFLKIIESYSWFTVIQLFTPNEIHHLLTPQLISKLRSPSLRRKYEFVRNRLQEIIRVAG